MVPSVRDYRDTLQTLVGVIEALLFVGDRYEARVALSDEQRILLFLARGGDWREGQRLQLHFPPDVVSVWPVSGG